tara:strand:- start:20631 stop:21941 length:1311 start_codon:yes stop_codon:yes gene_type:complete
MSKTFCPLPWIHLATRPNGDVRVCCTANASGAGITDEKEAGLVKEDGVAMNLRDHTIEQVFNSSHMRRTRLQMIAGEVPASCVKCFEEEAKGIVSKRQWETREWAQRLDLQKLVKQTKEDGTAPVSIPYFDLRLGNLCQLKCVMCSPHDSSSWIKEWKLQYPQYKNEELVRDQGWNEEFDYTWYKKGSFIDSMKHQAFNIQELYFAGGEPLLIPEHYKILEFMVDEGYAQDCNLRYNSNGLELPDKLFDLWQHFKEVRFNFSIDAYGERNEYIRYPSKWKDIEKNLKRLDENTKDNTVINIACAVQLLNAGYIGELAEWKMDQGFSKINPSMFGGGIIGTHLVYLPSYLNVKVLPHKAKLWVKDKLETFIDRQKFNLEFNQHPYGAQRWHGLIKYMMQEDWSSKLPAMREYLTVTDERRGTDYTKTFKELGELINE